MGAFPDVFSSANSRFKGTESRSEPRIRFRLATGEDVVRLINCYIIIIITGACLSSRIDRVVL